MSYYFAMRRALGAVDSLPYSRLDLLQCVDYKLSPPITANGRVTQLSDLSGNGLHLLPATAGNGPVIYTDSGGRNAVSFTAGQPMQVNYGQGYDAYTVALLYRTYENTGEYQFPYFGSPTPQYQPRPFIYLNYNVLKGYWGGGYGEYGSSQDKLRLAIFAARSLDGYNRVYHTDHGLTAQNSPGYEPITGATLGNDGNLGVRALLFWKRALEDGEILDLRDQIGTVHNLAL